MAALPELKAEEMEGSGTATPVVEKVLAGAEKVVEKVVAAAGAAGGQGQGGKKKKKGKK
jgi:hypothetical protein